LALLLAKPELGPGVVVGGASEEDVMYDGNNKDVNVPVPVKEDAAILDAIVDERTGMVLVYAVLRRSWRAH